MKPKTLMMLVVAGGCGLLALLGFQSMQSAQPKAKVETARVLVVIDRIEAGQPLTTDNVRFKEIPLTSILTRDPVLTEDQYKERSALIPMMPGDTVSMSKLSEPGARGASTQIPKGMRVHTISVTDSHTHSAMLRAGDRVDVLVTYKAKSQKGGTVTKNKTLLEYIEVFATDNRTAAKASEADTAKVKNVSLLLTPEQVSFVLLAQNKGQLSLSWRNKMDDQLVQVTEVDEKLLEELEGTVGMFEDRPLYEVTGQGAEPIEEMAPEPAVTAAAPSSNVNGFLDRSGQTGSAAQSTMTMAMPVVSVPAQPTWTMHVYQRNQAMPLQFAVPEEQPATTSASGNWLSSGLKSFFGANPQTPSGP